MNFNKKFLILIIIYSIFLTIGFVSASDNSTYEDISQDIMPTHDIDEISTVDEIQNNDSQISEQTRAQIDTKIETKEVDTYYQQDSQLVSYLKDNKNQPISNKKVSILINDKLYDKITDNQGKFALKLNLKPNTYKVTIKFDGDENYTESIANTIVKVKKPSLSINAKNYETFFESDLFFKVKLINKITKKPVKDVKVAFKVYSSNNKYKIYYACTDKNGMAKLKKNFKVGSYKVIISVKKNDYFKVKKTKAVLKVKETVETGCTSLYVQVSNTESAAGFRRDTTNSRTIHIVKSKLNSIPVIKQYKKNSYFFHLITAANGWMAGTGGADNPTINQAIEKLVGKMFKTGKIQKSYLKKIQGYERSLGIGHFSIKSPDGKYAVVWASEIKTGKLKNGEYLSVPNGKYCFRHGTWAKFSKNPAKAAIKIAATDSFGVNRRDATAFHWKATTKEGKTTATLTAYAANDNGRLMGRSTGYLKDDIIFKGKFFSKNNLPNTPSKLLLGVHKFGNIDKLIKIQTKVKAPKLTLNLNESNLFKATVKDKKTNKIIKGLKLKIKVGHKTYAVKTNSKGVAKLNVSSLNSGKYNVLLYSADIKYYVQAKSKIIIKE